MNTISRCQKTFVFSTIIVFLVGCLEVYAQDTIFWYQPDFPPYVIIKGADKEYGIQNRVNEYLISRLPEYKHTNIKNANYARILNNLKNQQQGVIGPIFKNPEREKFLLYSKHPCFLVLPNGLVVNRNNKKKFNPYILRDGTLDIEALCKLKKTRIGIVKGRTYKGILDEMINKYQYSKVFTVRHGTDHLGVIKMLLKNRFDATFGYPIEIKYAGFDSELEVLRIAKMTPYIPSYLAVTKNEWGQTLINKINAIMENNDALAEFYSYYEYWLSETDKTYYQKYLKEYAEKK